MTSPSTRSVAHRGQPPARPHGAAATLELIARVAHELRQPLGAAMAASHLIDIAPDRPPHPEAVAMLRKQFVRLNRLIDDLLDAGRGGLGLSTLRLQRVDLAAIVHDAAAATRIQMADSRVSLNVHVPADPVWIEGDGARLQQVLANLLTNAIAHTDAGTITLTLLHAGKHLRIEVRDSGRGIRPELLPYIFDMFTSGDHPNPTGLGLGLAIAREIVSQHGGSIDASSPGPGGGSQFTVVLPSRQLAAAADPPPMRPHARNRLQMFHRGELDTLIGEFLADFSADSTTAINTRLDHWIERVGRLLLAQQSAFYLARSNMFHRAHAWSRTAEPLPPVQLDPAVLADPSQLHRGAAITVPFGPAPSSYLVVCTTRPRTWPGDAISRLAIVAGLFTIVAKRQHTPDGHWLAGRVIAAQEDERRRIGRELHDHVTQRLALIGLQVDRTIAERREGIDHDLGPVRREIAELGRDVHELSHRLHSTTLDEMGLLPALQQLAGEIERLQGLQVSVEGDGDCACSAEAATCLFRIAEEAIANIVKHSGAASARIAVAASTAGVRMEIEDTGRGFDPACAEASPGMGLLSMRERLRILNGTLHIESAPERGTRIGAFVPQSGGRG